MRRSRKKGGTPNPRIIREGGYQPTSDPGSVPESLIRRAGSEKSVESPPKSGDEERLQFAEMFAHEARVDILRILGAREASPQELAKLLNMDLGNASYHVKFLENAGGIEEVRVERRRGAAEPYYRAVEMLSPVLEAIASKSAFDLRDAGTD